MVQIPALVTHADVGSEFEGIHAKVGDHRCAQFLKGLEPHIHAVGVLLEKSDFPVLVAQGGHAAIIRPINKLPARPGVFAFERGQKIVAVEVHFVGRGANLEPREQVILYIGIACSGQEGREHILVSANFIDHRAGLDHSRPANEGGNAISALPLGVFLATEHGGSSIRPSECLGAIVGGIHDDRIVIQAKFFELGENLADLAVVLDHAIGINPEACLALGFLFEVGEDVHAGGVPPKKKRLVRLCSTLHEVDRLLGNLLIDRLHAFLGEWSRVLDPAICKAVDDSTGTEFLFELGIFRVVGIFRLLLRIEVVEVAKKLLKSMAGRQHVITVAEVVFSKLTGHVALGLEKRGDRRVFFLHSFRRAREAHFCETCSDG